MNRTLVVFAAVSIVGLGAIAAPAPAEARPWNPWPWPSVPPDAPGPFYTHPGVVAPDALWDAYLRAREVTPYALYVEPSATLVEDRIIVRGGYRSGPRWHHRRLHKHRG